jgi:hypothetical protein
MNVYIFCVSVLQVHIAFKLQNNKQLFFVQIDYKFK